jgi:hypothetical protein
VDAFVGFEKLDHSQTITGSWQRLEEVKNCQFTNFQKLFRNFGILGYFIISNGYLNRCNLMSVYRVTLGSKN